MFNLLRRSFPPPPLRLTATLPRLCRPGPALAEQLGLDPLRFSDRNHPGAAPAVAPHPDVHLVDPATVAQVPLHVGGGVSNTPIVLEAVWDIGVTVAADEARNEGGPPQHVGHRADVDAGQALVAGRVIEHAMFSMGASARFMMLSGVRSMGSNVLK